MFFRQVLHDDLGCASYVIADGGEAAVVDPKWEIEEYVDLASEHGLRITAILETHNHADHVSGRGRLRAATGATIYVSERAGVEFEHVQLADGDSVTVGKVRLTALATPGHRPEHTSYVVEDDGRTDSPWLVLTGDSLFVGDVARPDLAVEKVEGARGLFHSLGRLLELEDYAEAWPAHIGGSLCGGAGMSEKPGSTIGFERRFNRLAATRDEDAFVRALTEQLAPQPPNFKRIVELNRGPLVTEAAELPPLAPEQVQRLLADGATLLDGREPRDFDAAHVPGSLNIDAGHSGAGTRAAWVVEPESPVVVAGTGDVDARRLGRMLEAVGFRDLCGILAGGLPAWRQADLPTASTEVIDPPELARRLEDGSVRLLDVRERAEWERGHVAGSLNVPYHDLGRDLPEEIRDSETPLAVACAAGSRASLAASLLERAGLTNVVHVTDGGVPDLAEEGVTLSGATAA